ncbi:MAG: hypothetical protein ACTSVV_03600, partial [Promethearchaeota archaeon]
LDKMEKELRTRKKIWIPYHHGGYKEYIGTAYYGNTKSYSRNSFYESDEFDFDVFVKLKEQLKKSMEIEINRLKSKPFLEIMARSPNISTQDGFNYLMFFLFHPAYRLTDNTQWNKIIISNDGEIIKLIYIDEDIRIIISTNDLETMSHRDYGERFKPVKNKIKELLLVKKELKELINNELY